MFRKTHHIWLLIRYKLKDGKPLSERLTNRYLLTIRNEENFAHKITYPFTYAKIVVFSTIFLAVLFSVSFYLSSTVLARWFHPVHKERETNRKLLQLSLSVDSLSEVLAQKEVFLASVEGVIKNDKKLLHADSTDRSSQPASKPVAIKADGISEADALRAEFEQKGNTRPATVIHNQDRGRLPDFFLFPPLSGGLISEKYDAKTAHYGVDIVAKKDEPIKCVADGTVIFSSFTDETGYVIAIQHHTNMISIFKHNSVLLKKAGDFVKAGDIIAIIGNTGSLTTGPHLHFELWYNGVAVNPELFVSL